MLRLYFLLKCTVQIILLVRKAHCQEHVIAKTNAINDYLNWCPKNAMCTYESSAQALLSCCVSCNCSDGCGYECCPDGPQSFMTEDEIVTLKRNDIENCIKPSIKTDLISQGWQFYEMIARCPYGYNESHIENKCLKPYKEFELGNNTWNIPIVINNTRVIYKNHYCAVCNDAPVDESIEWDAVLRCLIIVNSSPGNFLRRKNIASVSDIQHNIPQHCNILFRMPYLLEHRSHITNSKQCTGAIDRCNVTGEWTGESDTSAFHIESACLSYKSEYGGYRNIHCFLCNGGNTSDIKFDCALALEGFSFEDSILTVRNAINRLEDHKCSFGFIFDESTLACRWLHCSKGFLYNGIACVPFLISSSDAHTYTVYALTLTFEPGTSSLPNKVNTKSIYDTVSAIKHRVNNQLNLSNNTDFVFICDTKVFIKFKQPPIDLLNSLQGRKILFFDVMYIAVSLRFSVSHLTSASQIIEDLKQLYNVTNIHVTGAILIPYSRIIDQGFVERVLNPGADDFAYTNESANDLIKSIELNKYLKDALKRTITDTSDGLAVARLDFEDDVVLDLNGNVIIPDCNTVATVDADVFCPKVTLTANEYVNEDKGLLIKRVNRYLSRDIGYFGTGEDTVYICKDLYFKFISDGHYTVAKSDRLMTDPFYTSLITTYVIANKII